MRLLIVDDEHYIVNYLAALIEEQEIPDLTVHKCYSGVEALSFLQTSKVDLMLLDIHMPGLSGIQTAQKASALLPDCRIIFLTAYDKFEHIYETNKLRYSHYLLKTEPDEIILKEIHSALADIQKEKETLLLLSTAEQKSILLSHLLQQDILRSILTGKKLLDLKREIRLAGEDFILDLQSPVYLMYTQVHYRTLAESDACSSLAILEYLQLMRNLALNRFIFSMLDLKHGTMLWFFQPKTCLETEYEFLKSIANDFGDYCTSTLHRKVTAVLYPAFSPWAQVCTHFHEMQRYAESSLTKAPLIYSSVNVLENDTVANLISKSSAPDRSSLEHRLQELSFALYQNLDREYINILKQLGAECAKIKSMHNITAIRIYTSISLMLLNYIDLYHLQEKIASKIALYPLYYLQDFNSWNDAFLYFENLSRHIFDIQASKQYDKSERLINQIKLYIEEHLAESLTLTVIARVVNYNETYISRLFKQLSGTSLTEYITQERIKKAKYLLSSTSESMQDIAAALGFDTSQYFSSVFKKSTGISPSEYRRTAMYQEKQNN